MQLIAGKPAYRQIDLGGTHQLAVVDNAFEKARQHQTQGRFRVDTASAIIGAIRLFDQF
jgi:hypothetical protein